MNKLCIFLTAHLLLVAAFTQAQDNKPAAKTSALFPIQGERPSAKTGEYVLCPSRAFYDKAVKEGANRAIFIFYTARLVASGEVQSKVKNLAGIEFEIPNSMIISIPPQQKAKVGDILLTWWQSGSGMQRAIVVGGSESQPVVRYLDMDFDNPAGIGKKEETLKPDSFFVLNQPWQQGTSVVVDSKAQKRHGTLISTSSDQILVLEFGGKLRCYPKQDAKPIPMRPAVKVGEQVLAEVFGSYRPVTVTRVDPKIGRVFAKYKFGNKEKETAFAFGRIIAR